MTDHIDRSLPYRRFVGCKVLMQIREKDFQAIMLLMRELWWYQAMRTNLVPGERLSNYTGSITSCLETGTPGINTMRPITVSQGTTTLTIRSELNWTIPQHRLHWVLASNTTRNWKPSTLLVSVNMGGWWLVWSVNCTILTVSKVQVLDIFF